MATHLPVQLSILIAHLGRYALIALIGVHARRKMFSLSRSNLVNTRPWHLIPMVQLEWLFSSTGV